MEENNQYIEIYINFETNFVNFINQKAKEDLIYIERHIVSNGYKLLFKRKPKYKYVWKFCKKDEDFIKFINDEGLKGLRFIKFEDKNNKSWDGLMEEYTYHFIGWDILFEEIYY